MKPIKWFFREWRRNLQSQRDLTRNLTLTVAALELTLNKTEKARHDIAIMLSQLNENFNLKELRLMNDRIQEINRMRIHERLEELVLILREANFTHEDTIKRIVNLAQDIARSRPNGPSVQQRKDIIW